MSKVYGNFGENSHSGPRQAVRAGVDEENTLQTQQQQLQETGHILAKNGSQVLPAGERNLQIWRGRKLELTSGNRLEFGSTGIARSVYVCVGVDVLMCVRTCPCKCTDTSLALPTERPWEL